MREESSENSDHDPEQQADGHRGTRDLLEPVFVACAVRLTDEHGAAGRQTYQERDEEEEDGEK